MLCTQYERTEKDFGQTCKWIAKTLNLTLKGYTTKKGECIFKDAAPDQKVGNTYIEYSDKICPKELAILGPLVGENEVKIFKVRSAKSVTLIYTNGVFKINKVSCLTS